MGFTSYDEIIQAITVNGQGLTFDFFKGPYTPQGAGYWYTLWTIAGMPGAGSAPAAAPGGTSYDQAAGSIYFPDRDPQGTFMLTVGAVSGANATLMIYDRLVGVGGIALSPGGSRNINSVTVPRYNGAGVQAWIEVTTAIASGGAVSLMSYTNQDGVAGRQGVSTGYPFTNSISGTFVGPLPMQTGDTGIRSVEQIAVSTTTAGVANLVLIRPLVYLPLTSSNGWQEKDMVIQIAAMPQLYDGASLGIAIHAGSTAAQSVWGQIGVAWG